MTLFQAVCPAGLEKVLSRELKSLDFSVVEAPKHHRYARGVFFSGDWRDLLRGNLLLKTPSRITVPLMPFRADAFAEFVTKAKRLPWHQFLKPGNPIHFRITCKKSRLFHTGAISQRLATAIENSVGACRIIENADQAETEGAQLITVRMEHDHCYVDVDSSGNHFLKRGYRPAVGKAPLKEHLAAAMVLFSRWDGQSPLIDPFCGSASILLEGAFLSGYYPLESLPDDWHLLPFHRWPVLNSVSTKMDLPAKELGKNPPLLLGYDRNEGAIDNARINVSSAGLDESIQLNTKAFSTIEAPEEQGWIVSNLPYGVRTAGKGDLRNLYAKLGNILRDRFVGWEFTFLSNSEYLLGHMKLPFREKLQFQQGGLKVFLVKGKVGKS